MHANQPQPGDPPARMVQLILGFFKKGPTWSAESSPQVEADQRRHLATLHELRQSGMLLLSGPTPESGNLRGLVVFRPGSRRQVEGWLADDAHVRSGRLVIELHEWWLDAEVVERLGAAE